MPACTVMCNAHALHAWAATHYTYVKEFMTQAMMVFSLSCTGLGKLASRAVTASSANQLSCH